MLSYGHFLPIAKLHAFLMVHQKVINFKIGQTINKARFVDI